MIALLRIKLNSLEVRENSARNPRQIEEQIADAVFRSLQSFDNAEVFESREDDATSSTNPIIKRKTSFPYTMIMAKEKNSSRMDTSHKFSTAFAITPSTSFPPYNKDSEEWNTSATSVDFVRTMGTWRDRLIQVARYVKESFDYARAELLVHD